MDVRAYFLQALKAGAHYNTDWTISVFSRTNESPDSWRKDPYPFRLVKQRDGVFYVSEGPSPELIPLEGIDPERYQEPLVTATDEIDLLPGEYQYVKDRSLLTTYGQLTLNAILDYALKGRLGFFNEPHMSLEAVEGKLGALLQSEPSDPSLRNPAYLYPSDMERYYEAAFMLSEFAMVFTPGDTRKAWLQAPGTKELRDKLFAQHAHELHIPAVEAQISKQLEDLDRQWRADDASSGIFYSGKDIGVVRKKLYMFTGKEGGLVHDPLAVPIKRSLSEGWDLDRLEDYANGIRSGSYSRGIETAEGGELAKWLLRAFTDTKVDSSVEDCGTRFGLTFEVNERTAKLLVGSDYIDEAGQTHTLTEDGVGQYMGRTIDMRSPAFCILPYTDFCKRCAGHRLASDPTAVGSGLTAIGNQFMNISMKAMHGRVLATVEYDIFKELH